jgi:nucleoside-diphosphate-sugar epimerase
MIVVTGANGLLGSYILRRLLSEKVPVIGIKKPGTETPVASDLNQVIWREADVLDIESLEDAFKEATTVIHAAAIVSFNPRMERKMMEVNETGTRNVVNLCLEKKITNLIHISSVAAIGRQKGVNHINEQNKWQDGDLNTEYAISKHLAELEVWRGHEEGLNVAIVNPSVILAPPFHAKSSSQIFHYVMNEKRFYADVQTNYVDVRDVVELIWLILEKKIFGERFIASSGHISFIELTRQIAMRLNKRAPDIQIPQSVLPTLARISDWISWVTGNEPLITPQTAKLAKDLFYYSGQKAVQHTGLHYHTLEKTLDWCCQNVGVGYSTNN